MRARDFEASVRRVGATPVIDLHGEINAGVEDALDVAYNEAMKDNAHSVLLNFKDVGYIDSTGIALIVNLLGRSRGAGSRVLASGLSDHFQEIFRITRLTDFMSIFPDVDSALADISGSTEPSAAEQ